MTDQRNDEVTEFEIFGNKVRFKPSADDDISAKDVVDLLQKEITNITGGNYLGDAKTAVLVALKLAGDKLRLEREYKKNLDELQGSIDEAMGFIDKFTVITDNTVNTQ